MVFHKYNKIKMLGDEDNKDLLVNPDDDIVIQEKIDGANFRFMFKDGKIVFGSRTQQLESDSKGNWKRCIEYIKKQIENVSLTDYEGYIFYGECCVKHSVDYDWGKIPPFLGFDVKDTKTGMF